MINQVYTDENYLVVLWLGPRDVMFSYAQRGKAMSCHFATDDGQRYVREALEEFFTWIFKHYRWCQMILAQIKAPSVVRLVERMGFQFVIEADGHKVYQRGRGHGWTS